MYSTTQLDFLRRLASTTEPLPRCYNDADVRTMADLILKNAAWNNWQDWKNWGHDLGKGALNVVMPLSLGDQAVNDLFYEHILEMNQDETAKERMLYLVAHDKELIPIGSVVPHQGVTWYPLEAVSADNWTNRFSNKQLNHMAGNGVLILSKHTDGYICARHAVTTSKSPLSANPRTSLTMKMTEEMFVRNALLVKKEFRSSVKGFVGITNITQGTKIAILANINMKADQLKNDVDYPQLGGRITSGPDNLQVRQHALFTDHLMVSGRVDGPFPLKVLEFNLFI